MCKCFRCDNLQDGYPIKVIDIPSLSFMDDEVYHFEDGYHCTWSGATESNVEDLAKNGCRCTGGDWTIGIYSPYDVYPSDFDCIDDSMCDECSYRFGICWKKGYCIVADVN